MWLLVLKLKNLQEMQLISLVSASLAHNFDKWEETIMFNNVEWRDIETISKTHVYV